MPHRFRKTRPDINTSPAAWEQSWEQDFKRTYYTEPTGEFTHLGIYTPPGAPKAKSLDDVALSLYDHVNHICKSQEILAQDAAEHFARSDFENSWRSATDEKRREAILEGICKTMRCPYMDKRRHWCPDSTLSNLASENGETYIRMLKTALPADLDAPIIEPAHFPHPIMDRALSLSPKDEKNYEVVALRRTERLWRTYCLTKIVHNILLSFVS